MQAPGQSKEALLLRHMGFACECSMTNPKPWIAQAPGQSKEALLLRHARASQPSGPAGPTVYSAR